MSTANIKGLFKAASLMTNHVQHKRIRELKCAFKLWGIAICRSKVPGMGDSNGGISVRLLYILWNMRGGDGRGF